MNPSGNHNSESSNLATQEYYLDSQDRIYSSFVSAQNEVGSLTIDAAAIYGIVTKNYPIGDRTLVSELRKSPFLTSLESGTLLYGDLPIHSASLKSPENIAKTFLSLLEVEALEFLSDKQHVGLLLSGGMDSRIIASILRKLQLEGKYSGTVTGLTWGIESSRDVHYAEQIADSFGWDFKHFPISAETLHDNIRLCADNGAEYSPVHLHAMPAVSQLSGIDGILAGSYGDSIGRGEYSGRKLEKLPAILDKHVNYFALLKSSSEKSSIPIVKADLLASRERFLGRSEMQYREIEMQMHYMRRQLNSCMSVINRNIPLYQMFTSRDVYSYMWSLSPTLRTDLIYELILKSISNELLDIPWARTGRRYNSSNTKADTLTKHYHKYGQWLRNELREDVVSLIQKGNLQSLGVFSKPALNYWCKHWRTDSRVKADRLDEKMAWLASLSIFVEQYNVKSPMPVDSSYKDNLRLLGAMAYEQAYFQYSKHKSR